MLRSVEFSKLISPLSCRTSSHDRNGDTKPGYHEHVTTGCDMYVRAGRMLLFLNRPLRALSSTVSRRRSSSVRSFSVALVASWAAASSGTALISS